MPDRDRITEPVRKILQGRVVSKIINPVIIETRQRNFSDIAAIIRSMIPVQKLIPKQVRLPRIFGTITEVPFFNFKPIERFRMISAVLTRNLIEEIAQMREVRRIYPDSIQWALEQPTHTTPLTNTQQTPQEIYPTVPPQAVFRTAEQQEFTTTWWTKRVIGARKANQQGFTGRGVTTVVIDTGARKSHPQLRHVRIYSIDRKKGMLGQDSNGHGTWVASAVGGVHTTDRKYKVSVEGMAPGTRLASIQALGYIVGIGSTSGIIKAMDMAIGLGADIVSMSLGSDEQLKDEDNPAAIAIRKMKDVGIIPVIAAGNTGPGLNTIASPGSVLDALTVGAYNPISGALAQFSSRGPTLDGYIKPDVVAPGVAVDSALVGLLDGMVDKQAFRYGALSGTSMATPHISGLLACARQYFSERLGITLTVDMVKDAMAIYAETIGIDKNPERGWGTLTWDILMEYAEQARAPRRVEPCPGHEHHEDRCNQFNTYQEY